MTDRCESLDAYIDDEMSDAERTAFELHLATCDACQAELPRLLALLAAFDDAAEASRSRAPRLTLVADQPRSGPSEQGQPPGEPPRDRPRRVAAPAWRRAWVAGAGAVAIAAGLVAVAHFQPGREPATAPMLASLDLGPTRPFEPRLSYPGTGVHREVAVQRSAAPGKGPDRLGLQLQLEQARNWYGVAVVAMVEGDRSRAAAAFARAPATPQIDSDRAAFEILDGSPAALQRALDAADRALAAAPNHAAAHWNRALALVGLNLPLAAARDFDVVTALGEPGWASEARTRAAGLRAQVATRRVRWQQVDKAGRALIENGTPVPAELLGITGHLTIRLYDAVRSAPSRSAVEALLPLAQTLDGSYYSDHLTAYVRRIAASDFRARKPLSDAYRELVLGRMPKTEIAPFLERLEAAGAIAEDIWLGALVRTKSVGPRLDDYRQRAAATKDPWLIAISEQEAARAEVARGERAAAEARLRDAIVSARRARLGYRVTLLQNDLVALYRQTQNLVQAHEYAQAAYHDATSLGEGVVEANVLTDLAAINQDRYANRLARAYLTEILERTDPKAGPSPVGEEIQCSTRQYAYAALANVSLQLHEPRQARTEISLAPACSGPTPLGVLVRSELYRLERRDEDLRIAREHLAVLRADPRTAAPLQALLSYIEGSLLIDVDRSAGRKALRDAIVKAGHNSDPFNYSVKARAYSFSQLALDAGRASEFAGVIEILAETLEVGKPERCAVAIATQDERTVVAFADASGQIDGMYVVSKTSALPDVATLVPARIAGRLRACERVVVLTRAPVLGAARLLPPELAWSYLLKGSGSQPAATAPRHVIVANPEAPAELKLPSLTPYPDVAGSDAVVLRGADATPSRVALAMRDASVIEFHTHGFIGNDVSEASYLVLSSDIDRQYAMTANDVSRVKLEATPLVILGACHAATSSQSKEGGMGLAEAFLRSGARAVVASPDAVPDLDATAFFASVRDRVMRGVDPVVALRDERLHRLARSHDDAWVSGVVVFE